MLSLYRHLTLCLLFLLSTGCASSLTADKDPSVQLSKMDNIYVVRQPNDNRGVEKLIANHLNTLGKNATHGSNAEAPENTDAVVTYTDKWWWDITTYMLELNVELRDPRTNYVLARGHSYRTSLVRKSPEGMVEEVLGKIFENQ
jgi:hypothetical protein